MLGNSANNTPRTYLVVSKGKIEKYEKDKERTQYDYIEGTIDGIYSRERTFRGERVTYWYIDIRDKKNLYSMGFPYGSGTFKSIILSLASVKELNKRTPIRIETYLKNQYTNVVVWADGNKLDWATKELPPIEEMNVGDRTIRDDSKRMQFISSLVTTINRNLLS